MRTALDAEPHRAFPRQGPCRRRSGPTPRTSNGYRCGPVCQPGARGHGLPQPSRCCRGSNWNGGPGGVPAWRRLLRAVPAVWTPALVTERDRGLCGRPPWLKFLVHSETTHRFTWSQMASTPDRSHTPGAEARRSAWILKDSKADTALPVRSAAGASRWPCVGEWTLCGLRPCFQVWAGKVAGVQFGLQEALGEQGRGRVFGLLPGSAAEPHVGAPEAAAQEAVGPGLFRGCRARTNLRGAQGSCERSWRSCDPLLGSARGARLRLFIWACTAGW